jgi:hypothetical protein
MAEYRAYLIDDDGHFHDVFPLTCADDAEAIEMVKKLVMDRDVGARIQTSHSSCVVTMTGLPLGGSVQRSRSAPW